MILTRWFFAGWVVAGLLAAQAAAQSPLVGAWSASGTLAAAEANQAAAADEKNVYAITNAKVARYDRASGQRVAISTGDAQHLNSGFLWQGRLYCAHSNYPQIPEQSEIKVLDPESMQLATFKDFGNFGGSLTWAVQEGGSWWCNFARYGENNAETFLVKFDNHWKELARWTYPRALIGELGRYSLSGGVWRGGELLVTGHDDPVLFRLRLPTAGTELELEGRQAIPFTGQGIALDPKTGGLVGIDRAKRLVVFAALQAAEPPARKSLQVVRTDDFEVTGDGSAAAWAKATWEPLVPRGEKRGDATRVKTLYSAKGIYFLMQGADRSVTATMTEDFLDLWKEDVFEVFLWPDEKTPLYFEYEISPLGYELPILVPNFKGKFLGWRPWHYEGDRRIKKATSVQGGTKKSDSAATGWTAEFFVPYALLSPLENIPPKPGTVWRANFYRMDYDGGQAAAWDWSRVGPSFHDIQNFGALVFE